MLIVDPKRVARRRDDAGAAERAATVDAGAARHHTRDGLAVAALREQAEAPKVAGVYVAERPAPLRVRWLKLPLSRLISQVFRLTSRRVTHDMQVSARPWLSSVKPEQVLLWLPTHQTTLDFVNLLSLYTRLPQSLDLQIASRVLPSMAAQTFSRVLLPSFLFHLHRTSMGEGDNPEERARLQAANAAILAGARERYRRGGHAAAFPEGTTMGNGRIGDIKTGFYDLVRMPQLDGSILVVPAVPVGYTIDMLAAPWDGGRRRFLNFVNVGEPIVYEPVVPLLGESPETYRKRDARALADRVRAALITSSTVTTSQLVGTHMLAQLERGERVLRKADLEPLLADRSRALAMLGYAIDEELHTVEGRRERIEALWTNLVGLGYVRESDAGVGTLDAERVRHEPIDTSYPAGHPKRFARFKHDNPLLYCANRLLQLAEEDPRVAAVMGGQRDVV